MATAATSIEQQHMDGVHAGRPQEYPDCGECQSHDCMDHAVPYESDGPLGHGFECGRCGAFLQAG